MKRNRRLSKYLLLALVITAMFAMSGCRTRITNNNEVSNVYYDEDGFLSETYQMRRDELGLSTADSPIFPDLGSGDTEEDFDSSEDSNFNYEPEEDTYVEPPTTTTTTTHHSSSGRHSYTSPGSHSGGSNTTTNWVIVTLDANGGKDITGALRVKKGEKYGKLPTPEWKDSTKSFKEWNTKKDGSGSKVTSDTPVKTSKKHTLYAQWKENETKQDKPDTPNTYKVVFYDYEGGKKLSEKDVEEGEAATAPAVPKRPGYDFIEWDQDYSNIISDLTVNGKWKEKEGEAYWQDMFDDACSSASSVDCIISPEKNWVKKCKIKPKDNAEYVIGIVDWDKWKSGDETTVEQVNALIDKGSNVYIVSDKANDSDNTLAYQIALMKLIHESDIDPEDTASAELGVEVNIEKIK